jgi:ectoine hydroxylase-related dioxygenase (phytanoyl-CoA dioxygenase family)
MTESKTIRFRISSGDTLELTAFQRTLEGSGFAIISDVLTEKRLEPIEQELTDSSSHRSRAGIRHALKLPSIAALARESSLLRVARSVLGERAFPYRVTVFEKTTASNWLVVWHQDTALPLRNRRDAPGWGPWSVKDGVTYAHAPASALQRVLALRVHLDDSERDNGPLRVLPKTHTFGVLTDDAIHELSQRVKPVDCLVPKGGILAMRPLIVHSSSKCESRSRRRVLHIEYAGCESFGDILQIAIT